MRTPRAEYLRREIECVRGECLVDRDGVRVAGERALQLRRTGGAVVGVVVQEADLQTLWDQVLSEPERDAVIGRSDPEDVRPCLCVDERLPAGEDDADRDTAAVGDAPRRVDSRPLVDDRDGAVGDRLPDVGDRAGGREAGVHRADVRE